MYSTRKHSGLTATAAAVYAFGLAALDAVPVRADGAPQPRVIHAIDRYPYVLWRETWGGGDMLATAWSVYSGATVALTGDIEGDGWRLRTTGGYGRYSYRKWIRGLDGPEHLKMTGQKVFSDVLLGYHYQWHNITLKAFAGLASERQIDDPRDPDAASADFTYGGKAAIEAWLALSNRYWVAGDAAWASTFNTYKLGLRTGYQLLDDLDAGVEARFEGNDAYMGARAGVFTTLRFGDAGVTAAAGITGDRDWRAGHYASVSLFYRY